jgi:hypothetical protein
VYQTSSGVVNSVAITGVSADAFGTANFTYDLLVFTAQPYLDSRGLLLSLAPGALTRGGVGISGDQVAHVALGVNGSVIEEVMGPSGVVSVAVSFAVSATAMACSVPGFEGSSGLSSGAIAGIVIGSVVGALLLLALLLLAVRSSSLAGRRSSTATTSSSDPSKGAAAYALQRDASQSNRSSTVQLA